MVDRKRRAWKRRIWGSPRYKLIRQSDFFHKDVERAMSSKMENFGVDLSNAIVNQLKRHYKNKLKYSDDTLKEIVNKFLKKLNTMLKIQLGFASREEFEMLRDHVFNVYGIQTSPRTLERDLIRHGVNKIMNLAQDSLVKLEHEQIEKITDFIDKGQPDLHEFLNNLVDVSVDRAETISRTLLGSLANDALGKQLELVSRRLGYDENTAKYRWRNPLDHRTTKACKEIVDRTKNGVTMNEMKSIIKEESQKYFKDFYKADNPLFPHFQCRSVIELIS